MGQPRLDIASNLFNFRPDTLQGDVGSGDTSGRIASLADTDGLRTRLSMTAMRLIGGARLKYLQAKAAAPPPSRGGKTTPENSSANRNQHNRPSILLRVKIRGVSLGGGTNGERCEKPDDSSISSRPAPSRRHWLAGERNASPDLSSRASGSYRTGAPDYRRGSAGISWDCAPGSPRSRRNCRSGG